MSYVIASRKHDGTVERLGTAETEDNALKITRALTIVDMIGRGRVLLLNSEVAIDTAAMISRLVELYPSIPADILEVFARYGMMLQETHQLSLDCAEMSGMPAEAVAKARAILKEAEEEQNAALEALRAPRH